MLGPYPYHARAEPIAKTFPEDWSAFTKFCVVRNPWDKIVSDYFWRIRKSDTPPTFEAFVKAIRDGGRLGGIVPGEPDNWPLYTINDRIAVDEVVRFETLSTDLHATLQRLGVPCDGKLTRAKSGFQPKTEKPGTTRMYTPELEQIVGDLFRKEVEAFRYVGPSSMEP